MLRDKVKIRVSAGTGGKGALIFNRGMPDGGDGGIGGNLYFQGSYDRDDLSFLNPEETIKAEDGQEGDRNNRTGHNGEDLILKVPVGTEVYTMEGYMIGAVDEKDAKILIAKGGRGGRGNTRFKGRNTIDPETYKHHLPGKPGQAYDVKLVLKLKADVVFIGLPNAGKSSLLNAMTNAKAAVANYPFTTLNPHMGSLPGLKLLDLPGLIEGTADGKGLGTGFIQHTEKAKLAAHFISLESDDLMRDYETIRKELVDISENLATKKEIILLTKRDLLSDEEIEERVKSLKKLGKRIVVCSAFRPESLKELEAVFREEIKDVE
jgi:GTPase